MPQEVSNPGTSHWVQPASGALYELAQKLSEKVAKLEEELLLVQEERDTLRVENDVLTEQIQRLQRQRAEEAESLHRQRAEEVQSLHQQRGAEVHALHQKRGEEVEALQKQVEALHKVRAEEANALHQKRGEEVAAVHLTRGEQIKALKQEHAQQVEKMHVKRGEEVDALGREHAKQIKALKREQAQEVAAVHSKRGQQIKAVKQEKGEQVEALQKQVEALHKVRVEEVQALHQKHGEEVAAVHLTRGEQVKALKQEHAQQVQALQKQMEALHYHRAEELHTLHQQRGEEVAAVHLKRGEEITALKRERSEQAQQIKVLQDRLQALQEENQLVHETGRHHSWEKTCLAHAHEGKTNEVKALSKKLEAAVSENVHLRSAVESLKSKKAQMEHTARGLEANMATLQADLKLRVSNQAAVEEALQALRHQLEQATADKAKAESMISNQHVEIITLQKLHADMQAEKAHSQSLVQKLESSDAMLHKAQQEKEELEQMVSSLHTECAKVRTQHDSTMTEDCYISYANAPETWRLDDGSFPPRQKPFELVSYDEASRTFKGTVRWREGFDGATRWDYTIVFSEDLGHISGGKPCEDSLTDSALSDMEVALEDGEPPPGRRPEKLLPPARSETSSGEAFEEKLQPTTLLQGMDQVVSVLMGIRQAIEVQSEDVGRSIDSFLSLAETLRKSGELGDDLILDEDESHDVSFAHGSSLNIAIDTVLQEGKWGWIDIDSSNVDQVLQEGPILVKLVTQE
eukprot:g16748.t1